MVHTIEDTLAKIIENFSGALHSLKAKWIGRQELVSFWITLDLKVHNFSTILENKLSLEIAFVFVEYAEFDNFRLGWHDSVFYTQIDI